MSKQEQERLPDFLRRDEDDRHAVTPGQVDAPLSRRVGWTYTTDTLEEPGSSARGVDFIADEEPELRPRRPLPPKPTKLDTSADIASKPRRRPARPTPARIIDSV